MYTDQYVIETGVKLVLEIAFFGDSNCIGDYRDAFIT